MLHMQDFTKWHSYSQNQNIAIYINELELLKTLPEANEEALETDVIVVCQCWQTCTIRKIFKK